MVGSGEKSDGNMLEDANMRATTRGSPVSTGRISSPADPIKVSSFAVALSPDPNAQAAPFDAPAAAAECIGHFAPGVVWCAQTGQSAASSWAWATVASQ